MPDNDKVVLPLDLLADKMDAAEQEELWSKICERVSCAAGHPTYRAPFQRRFNVWAAGLAGVAVVAGGIYLAHPRLYNSHNDSESQPAPSREAASVPIEWIAPSYIPPGLSDSANVQVDTTHGFSEVYQGPGNDGKELTISEVPNGSLPSQVINMASSITIHGQKGWLLDRSSHGGDTQVWFVSNNDLIMVRGLKIPLDQLMKTATSLIDSPVPMKHVDLSVVPSHSLVTWRASRNLSIAIPKDIAPAKFNTFYLPTQTASGDALENVTLHGKVAIVKFRHMTLTESETPVMPQGTITQTHKVALPSLDQAELFTVKGTAANQQSQVLSMHRGTCYILISGTALTTQQLEAIGSGMAPLNG